MPDALRAQVREKEGRNPTPSAASIDSQSTKTTEQGGERGYDGAKKLTGRKRHLLVDIRGLLIAAVDDAAALQGRSRGRYDGVSGPVQAGEGMARLDVLGPVYWFEVLTSSRRGRQFVLRAAYASVLFAVLAGGYRVHGRRDAYSLDESANLAGSFFESFAIVQLCVVLFVAPAMIAAAVAQERERRTIEHLLVSQLSSREIVLGKLAGRMSQVASLLLAGVPVLAIAMLMGGIAPDSLARVFIATLAVLTMVAGVSIWVSVHSKTTSGAIKGAYWAIVIVHLVVLMFGMPVAPLLGALLEERNSLGRYDSPGEWMFVLNPFGVLSAALEAGATGSGKTPWPRFFTGVFVQVAAGAIGALRAIRSLRTASILDHSYALVPQPVGLAPASSSSVADAGSIDRTIAGTAARRDFLDREASSRLLDRDPVLWRELYGARRWNGDRVVRIGAGHSAIFLLVCSIYPMAIMMSMAVRHGEDTAIGLSLALSAICFAAGVHAVMTRAATSIAAEKDRGTWTSLLAAPLDRDEIYISKFLAALHAGKWMALVAAAVWIVPVMIAPSLFIVLLASGVMGAITFAFVAALGLAISQRAQSASRASLTTFLIAFLLGGGYLLLAAPLAGDLPGTPNIYRLATFCAPHLIGAPAMIWYELQDGGRDARAIFISFVIGAWGYAIATGAIYFHTRANFERLAGRIVPGAPPTPSPRQSSGSAP